MRALKHGLFALCLSPLLLGCAVQTKPSPPIEVERVIYRYPPASLALDCPEPVFGGRINGDLLLHIESWRTAFRQCNADKSKLREWQKQAEEADHVTRR